MKKVCSILFLSILLCKCSSINGQDFSKGIWIGSIKEQGTIYSYTLEVHSIIDGQVKGISISENNSFYCSTEFSGELKNKQIEIKENKVIKTNYKNKSEICLMVLKLGLNDNILSGKFTSSNSLKKNCGNGFVSLRLKRRDSTLMRNFYDDNKVSTQIISKILSNNIDSLKSTSTSKPISPFINARKIDLTNELSIPADSVRIEIYDNGIIDGDQVTLLINKEVIIKSKIISDKPIEIDLLKKNGTEFVIEFFADNLGGIPPNTGLIIIKNNMFRKELTFSSDFSKTNAIKIILNH